MSNIVYVLTNEVMPGLVKIGKTDADDVQVRVQQLSAATGVPLPFECFFAAEVKDASRLEKTLHQLFSKERVNQKREFFRVEAERVVLAISIGEFQDVTPTDTAVVTDEQEKTALDKIKLRRSKINLEALEIREGATLIFSRDESITAEVTRQNRVLFEGEELSLSASALKILHRLGYKTPAASGTGYWMFEDELLDERRVRMENQRFTDGIE